MKFVLIAALALLAACSTPAVQTCVPPQQYEAGVCVDTDGHWDNSHVENSAPQEDKK